MGRDLDQRVFESSQKWRIQLVPLWFDLKESRIARRSEARICPLTLMCHSCERPLQQNGQMVGGTKVKVSSDIIKGILNISKRTAIFVIAKVMNNVILNGVKFGGLRTIKNDGMS